MSARDLRTALQGLRLIDDVELAFARNGQTIEVVVTSSRHRVTMRARTWLMSELRRITQWSYPELGRLFNRDHTTVIVACKNEALLEEGRRMYGRLAPATLDMVHNVDDVAAFLLAEADRLAKEPGIRAARAAREIERIAGLVRRRDFPTARQLSKVG